MLGKSSLEKIIFVEMGVELLGTVSSRIVVSKAGNSCCQYRQNQTTIGVVEVDLNRFNVGCPGAIRPIKLQCCKKVFVDGVERVGESNREKRFAL